MNVNLSATIQTPHPPNSEPWAYADAFARNFGIVDAKEQDRLKNATVAIAGLGGVGGGHALTLARLGVGGFRLADSDCFSVANFNRQAGATLGTLGRNKAGAVGRMIRDINPEARLGFQLNVTHRNIDEFLDGVDVVLDGIDFFAIRARRLLFERARARGLWALTAGPIGFGAALVAFSPEGMSFDEYCDIRPGMSEAEQIVAFAAALTPRPMHLGYMDLGAVDFDAHTGPSSSIACQLSSAMIATEAMAILTKKRVPRPAPAYAQFDPYRRAYREGRLHFGNRGPLQRLKRALFMRRLKQLGVLD